MQLVTCSLAGGDQQPGVLVDDDVVLVRPLLGLGGPRTVAELLGAPRLLDRLRAAVAEINADPAAAHATGVLHARSAVTLHAPLGERVLIVCAGANYHSHALNAVTPDARPAWFVKSPNAVAGPDTEVALPLDHPDRVDYEGELCVVFGRPCHRARAEDAYTYIAGYTLLNDISARDAWPALRAARTAEEGRRAWLDMLLGKQFPTFAPMGPAVTTADEVGVPTDLRLTTSLNGQIVQDASTRDLIVGIPELVEQLSRHFSFAPGDVLSTGSPPGVGVTRTPPRYLRPGDAVSVAVERVGVLTNHVAAPTPDGDRAATRAGGSAHD